MITIQSGRTRDEVGPNTQGTRFPFKNKFARTMPLGGLTIQC